MSCTPDAVQYLFILFGLLSLGITPLAILSANGFRRDLAAEKAETARLRQRLAGLQREQALRGQGIILP